ncbi:MAG: hypothetical protein AB7W59_25710 [Acidimicrobiia bacterium]
MSETMMMPTEIDEDRVWNCWGEPEPGGEPAEVLPGIAEGPGGCYGEPEVEQCGEGEYEPPSPWSHVELCDELDLDLDVDHGWGDLDL